MDLAPPRNHPAPPGKQAGGPPTEPNSWYQAQGWLVGANFITSSAINQLEMFQPNTFDPRRIDTELGWARSGGSTACGSSSTICCGPRMPEDSSCVWRSSSPWRCATASSQCLCSRLVLGPAAEAGSAAGRRDLEFITRAGCRAPVPTPRRCQIHRLLRDYVTGVLTQFRSDDRVLGWDLWNEPDNPARVYQKVERKTSCSLSQTCSPKCSSGHVRLIRINR